MTPADEGIEAARWDAEDLSDGWDDGYPEPLEVLREIMQLVDDGKVRLPASTGMRASRAITKAKTL